uniref:Uncharacterized protein n=1 Tax=Euplotes crassus TaxID=5936 RepID=A0A7S3KN16_EUPCR|mmetsp:Transcript_361/g.317  ORF Transcript_361/g.317 Transcript_361/m.317 type:complete len:195 (+) Transcript_361:1026-1610(+)
MLDLYHTVTTGSICEYEEGVIMMLVLRNPGNPSEDKVLSCSKIKTIEYKVFKKVKDKLKNYWENYEKVTYITKKMEKEYKTKFERFKTEVNDIFKSHLSPDSKYRKSKQSTELVKFGKAAFDNVMFDISLYNLMKTDYSVFCEKVLAKISDEDSNKFSGKKGSRAHRSREPEFSLTSRIFNSEVTYPFCAEPED